MIEALKRMFVLGVGIAALTKEKAEKEVKRLVKAGKISSREGEKLLKILLKEVEKHKNKLRKVAYAELQVAEIKGKRIVSKKLAKNAPKAVVKGAVKKIAKTSAKAAGNVTKKVARKVAKSVKKRVATKKSKRRE